MHHLGEKKNLVRPLVSLNKSESQDSLIHSLIFSVLFGLSRYLYSTYKAPIRFFLHQGVSAYYHILVFYLSV